MSDQIRALTVPLHNVMVSFDVVSMFTNVPTDLDLLIIEERWEEIQTLTTINKNQLIALVGFIFDNCFFKYNNNIYQQHRDLPMGSSLSPALADLVLDRLLDHVWGVVGHLTFYLRRYVDDLFLIIPEQDVQYILDQFNQFHPRIQFTMELEKEKSINFLELTITRQPNGKLLTSWYRKPTASLRYIDFYSNHTFSQKRNIIDMLARRLYHFSDNSNLMAQ